MKFLFAILFFGLAIQTILAYTLRENYVDSDSNEPIAPIKGIAPIKRVSPIAPIGSISKIAPLSPIRRWIWDSCFLGFHWHHHSPRIWLRGLFPCKGCLHADLLMIIIKNIIQKYKQIVVLSFFPEVSTTSRVLVQIKRLIHDQTRSRIRRNFSVGWPLDSSRIFYFFLQYSLNARLFVRF